MIGRDQRASTGHILYDETGISRDEFAPVLSHETGPYVISRAGGEPDNDSYAFAFIERHLRGDVRSPEQTSQECCKNGFHNASRVILLSESTTSPIKRAAMQRLTRIF